MISEYNRIFQSFQEKEPSSRVLRAVAPLILQTRFNNLYIAITASVEKRFVIVTLTQALEGGDVVLFCLLIGKFLLNMDLYALTIIWN